MKCITELDRIRDRIKDLEDALIFVRKEIKKVRRKYDGIVKRMIKANAKKEADNENA